MKYAKQRRTWDSKLSTGFVRFCVDAILLTWRATPGTTVWRVLGRRWPADTEGSCEYIELAVADSRWGMVFQLGGWARGKRLTVKKKNSLLRNIAQDLGLRQIIWNTYVRSILLWWKEWQLQAFIRIKYTAIGPLLHSLNTDYLKRLRRESIIRKLWATL